MATSFLTRSAAADAAQPVAASGPPHGADAALGA